jgi:hypothetical protein
MDRSMADSLYFQPTTTPDSGLTGRQYRTMRGRLLHNINNTMEGEGGIKVSGTASFSIIMGHDDQRKRMMIDGAVTWFGVKIVVLTTSKKSSVILLFLRVLEF